MNEIIYRPILSKYSLEDRDLQLLCLPPMLRKVFESVDKLPYSKLEKHLRSYETSNKSLNELRDMLVNKLIYEVVNIPGISTDQKADNKNIDTKAVDEIKKAKAVTNKNITTPVVNTGNKLSALSRDNQGNILATVKDKTGKDSITQVKKGDIAAMTALLKSIESGR